MKSVESKLGNLDKQLQQLTLDFQLASSKQEENTGSLSIRLNDLKQQLEDTRSLLKSSAPVAPPISASIQTPASPPRKSQEILDAELAKMLQDEFDQQQQHQQHQQQHQQQQQQQQIQQQQQFHQQQIQQQPPQLGRTAYTPGFQQVAVPPQYLAQSQPPPATIQYGYPNPQTQQVNRAPTSDKQDNCPVCGGLFPVGRPLEEHVNTHFGQAPSQQPQRSDSGGNWFGKLFKKDQNQTPPQQMVPAPGQPNYAMAGFKPVAGPPTQMAVPPGYVLQAPYPGQMYNPSIPQPYQ